MDCIAVVGASIAAVRAVEALRDEGFDRRIVMVGAESHLPYDRPPLSKQALATRDLSSTLLHPQAWYDDHGVELELGRAATRLDPGQRMLHTGARGVAYDALVVATGVQARPLPTAAERGDVHVLRTRDDFVRLDEALDAARRVCVVGAGFIGLEVAAGARARGLEVVVLEADPTPLHRHLGAAAGRWVERLHRRHGIDVRCGVRLRGVARRGSDVVVHLEDGDAVATDLVVAGIGVVPTTQWLAGSGVALDEAHGGVRCDASLRASVPGVVAAGDVASWHHVLFDRRVRVEHWTTAAEQGRHAALTLLGQARPFEAVPYVWSDQWEARMKFVGMSAGADETTVVREDMDSLEVVYTRRGIVTGALCVNAAKRLVTYRRAVLERRLWADVVTV